MLTYIELVIVVFYYSGHKYFFLKRQNKLWTDVSMAVFSVSFQITPILLLFWMAVLGKVQI